MNITILARSPPAGFFLCPKSSNKQGEELMNDIFENVIHRFFSLIVG